MQPCRLPAPFVCERVYVQTCSVALSTSFPSQKEVPEPLEHLRQTRRCARRQHDKYPVDGKTKMGRSQNTACSARRSNDATCCLWPSFENPHQSTAPHWRATQRRKRPARQGKQDWEGSGAGWRREPLIKQKEHEHILGMSWPL